jgi:hypothetical protein
MNPTFITINNPLAAGGGVDGTYIYDWSGGINDAGDVIGSYFDSNGVSHGYLDIGGNFTALTDPTAGTAGTYAFDVNNHDEVVGTFLTETAYGYVYLKGAYQTISDPLGTATYALGINNQGDVVGNYQFSAGPPTNNGREEGFIYSHGKYTTISDPNGTITTATGIDDKGDVVGYYEDTNGIHGFFYSKGQFTTINDPLAPNNTILTGINNKGQIVGYAGPHGFLYDHGNFVPVDDPLGFQSTLALGINNHSYIVGTYQGDAGIQGFVVHGVSTVEVL